MKINEMQKLIIIMVGTVGFEPTAPWSQTRCATGLRYSPKITLFIEWEAKVKEKSLIIKDQKKIFAFF